MSDFFAVFPTTIARYTYDAADTLAEIVDELIQTAPTYRLSGINQTARHFYEDDTELLDNPKLTKFKDFILDSANRYVKDLLMIDADLQIAGAWINQSNTGFSEGIHNHSNSYVSGTYYVNFDKSIHGNLAFYKNSSNLSLTPYLECLPLQVNDLNAERFSISDLRQGELVVWPSHVEHGYLQPNTGDNRISITVNFIPTIISNGMYKFKVSKG
jgi:hypothetical protein